VALIRDLRRQVPCPKPEEDPVEEMGVPAWWYENWQAEPTRAEPTTAKLIPIVTTAQTIDALELAQTYIRRWPLQENVIRDYLLLAAGSIPIMAMARPPSSIQRSAKSEQHWRSG
jgi:hypothetical protein